MRSRARILRRKKTAPTAKSTTKNKAFFIKIYCTTDLSDQVDDASGDEDDIFGVTALKVGLDFF